MVIHTIQGVILTVSGNTVLASDGNIYNIMLPVVEGPGVYSTNVQTKDKAIGIIVGEYGGRRF